MNLRPLHIPVILLTALTHVGSGADAVSFAAIAPERIGEFVTVSGKVAAFYPPPEPQAPYAFALKDASGQQLRVVAWPDIYMRVDNHQLLEKPGTSVTLTAEVAEYKDKLELHLQDWEEITIEENSEGTNASAGSAETTGVKNMWWGGGEITTQPAALSPVQQLEQETSVPVSQ